MSRSWSGLTGARTVASVVALFLVLTGTAHATDDPAAAEAKRHYEEGTKAFNLGEYPRAIAEFKATYNAKPDPLLLYNIAQSYRLAEDASQALFFYKSFLRNMPGATNRKEVEGRIKEMEKKVADQKKDPSTAPPPVIVPTLPTSPTPSVPPPGPGTAPAATPPPAGTAPSTSEGMTGTTRPAAPPPPGAPLAQQPSPPPTTPGEPQFDLSAPVPPPEPETDRPFYKKWWFWAGAVGALIIITGIGAANARKEPDTALGTWDPTWRP